MPVVETTGIGSETAAAPPLPGLAWGGTLPDPAGGAPEPEPLAGAGTRTGQRATCSPGRAATALALQSFRLRAQLCCRLQAELAVLFECLVERLLELGGQRSELRPKSGRCRGVVQGYDRR